MAEDFLQRIVLNVPEAFWRRFSEGADESYFAAHKEASTYQPREQSRVRGQLRHHRLNEGLRNAAAVSRIEMLSPPSTAWSDWFNVAAAGEVRIARVALPFSNRIPRPAKHRRLVAAINTRFEPDSADFFDPLPPKPASGLGCLIVTVHPHRSQNQGAPAAVMLGVPFSDLRGWHFLEPISKVLAAYHPAVEQVVPDLAIVRLKKKRAGGR